MEKFISEHKGKTYTIEPEEFTVQHTGEKIIWYYVYEWGERGAEYDFLQDTFSMAKRCALKQFGVPLDGWQKLGNNKHPYYDR